MRHGSESITGSVTVASDIGGTFTDIIVATDGGRLLTRKVPTTTGRHSEAVIAVLQDLVHRGDINATQVASVLHGTTIATNTVLQQGGARVALITTKGFRDVLDIGRLRMPVMYDMMYQKPVPLVPRRHTFEIDERMAADGTAVKAIDERDIEQLIDDVVAADVESIAVCLLNSYANPAHERQVERVLQRLAPHIHCTLSVDLIPEMGEYERTSTTAVNAYLVPVMWRYFDQLVTLLQRVGVEAPIRVMQSSGGTMLAEAAAKKPIFIVQSGPAAGVVAAQAIGSRLQNSHVIAFDMGGTTAKASLIERGELTWANESVVGGPLSLGARLMQGGGYVINLPAIDIAEVGAGGGSIVAIDAGGAIQVGPQSAGSNPGPVAYDTGGTQSTVTDANVLLGYISPSGVAGGAVTINKDKCAAIFERDVAAPLGMAVEDAAGLVHQIANSNMIRAINAVSTERGRDPGEFTLIASGGSGPVHAPAMAAELGINRVIVPPAPGLFSAYGLFFATPEYHASRTILGPLNPATLGRVRKLATLLERQVKDEIQLLHGQVPVALATLVALRYVGQSHSLPVVCDDMLDMDDEILADELRRNFEKEYRQTYGHASEEGDVETTAIRLVGRVHDSIADAAAFALESPGLGHARKTRAAFFPLHGGWHETPVLARPDLGPEAIEGPLVIEEYDATTVVPPDWRSVLHETGCIILEKDDR